MSEMKKVFKKWIIPICISIIICSQLLTFYLKDEINIAIFVVVIALIPAALKGLEYNISKRFEWCITILAVVLFIYTLWATM